MTHSEAKEFLRLYREFGNSQSKITNCMMFQERVELEVLGKAPAWMSDEDAAWRIHCATTRRG
jgi:hypothetical protein